MTGKLLLRTAAVAVLAGVLLMIVVVLHQRPDEIQPEPAAVTAPRSDDLSAGFWHCSALGPNDPIDPACRALWDENRRRFFGKAVSHE
ncbi:hypothetical protein GALL_245590 [mine drainage metagenome]|uniref:Conjugative transfer region protein TrbK n=1 Tax=mine drainage metagenome TaxID=410659 RepID=A0A1J5RBP4_9ZZZZ